MRFRRGALQRGSSSALDRGGVAAQHTGSANESVDGILMSSLIRSFGVPMSARLKKLTIQVPEDLLARAAAASGEGVAPTIRRSLELMAAGAAYAKLRRLRGKIRFGNLHNF